MENKNRLIEHGGISTELYVQDEDLETYLQHIAELTGFKGNPLYIAEISKHLLFNGKITLKEFHEIQTICERGSGP